MTTLVATETAMHYIDWRSSPPEVLSCLRLCFVFVCIFTNCVYVELDNDVVHSVGNN